MLRRPGPQRRSLHPSCLQPTSWHQWRKTCRSCSFIVLGRGPRLCASYYLDKQNACDRRGEVDSATSPGNTRNIGGSCRIDSSLSWNLNFSSYMSLSSLARSLNPHLLASLLRPSAAHISPPDLAPSFTTRKQSSTSRRCPQDVSPSSTSSTVSQIEVSHFSRLASSWWDPHGPSRLLHLMNPLRHDFIKSCLQSSPEPTDPGRKY